MQARQAEVSVLFLRPSRFFFHQRTPWPQPKQSIGSEESWGEFFDSCHRTWWRTRRLHRGRLMAMWGAPNEQPNHAELACRAAMEIRKSLDLLNEIWKPVVDADTEVGIGVNTGEALVGNIGTHRKFKYGPPRNNCEPCQPRAGSDEISQDPAAHYRLHRCATPRGIFAPSSLPGSCAKYFGSLFTSMNWNLPALARTGPNWLLATRIHWKSSNQGIYEKLRPFSAMSCSNHRTTDLVCNSCPAS